MVEGRLVITYREVLLCISLWFTMTRIQGFQWCNFWSNSTIDPFDTVPYPFNDILPQTRFGDILKSLNITDEKPPEYKDPFWYLGQLIDVCYHKMETCFSPRYISCLYESTGKWFNKYIFPGSMFVPRKPWLFGNEWHTISCSDSDVLFLLG